MCRLRMFALSLPASTSLGASYETNRERTGETPSPPGSGPPIGNRAHPPPLRFQKAATAALSGVVGGVFPKRSPAACPSHPNGLCGRVQRFPFQRSIDDRLSSRAAFGWFPRIFIAIACSSAFVARMR